MNENKLTVNIPEGFEAVNLRCENGQVIFDLVEKKRIEVVPYNIYKIIDVKGKVSLFMAKSTIPASGRIECEQFLVDLDTNNVCIVVSLVVNCTDKLSVATSEEQIQFLNIIKSKKGLVWNDDDKKFESVKPKYPEKWDDLGLVNGFYIDNCSDVRRGVDLDTIHTSKNTFKTKRQARSFGFIASQLSQLKDVYNDGKPIIWDGEKTYYTIRPVIEKGHNMYAEKSGNPLLPEFLAFHKEEQRDLFLNNFKDLILEYFKGLM